MIASEFILNRAHLRCPWRQSLRRTSDEGQVSCDNPPTATVKTEPVGVSGDGGADNDEPALFVATEPNKDVPAVKTELRRCQNESLMALICVAGLRTSDWAAELRAHSNGSHSAGSLAACESAGCWSAGSQRRGDRPELLRWLDRCVGPHFDEETQATSTHPKTLQRQQKAGRFGTHEVMAAIEALNVKERQRESDDEKHAGTQMTPQRLALGWFRNACRRCTAGCGSSMVVLLSHSADLRSLLVSRLRL